MKDKELKIEETPETSISHNRYIRGTRERTCPGEREVERIHMIFYHRNIQYILLVPKKEARHLVECAKPERVFGNTTQFFFSSFIFICF